MSLSVSLLHDLVELRLNLHWVGVWVWVEGFNPVMGVGRTG